MSYASDKTRLLTNLGTDISSKVTAHSISPTDVGGNTVSPDLHGIAGVTILTDDLYSLISAAGDFNSVLTVGNVSVDNPAVFRSAFAGLPNLQIGNGSILLESSTGVPLFVLLRTGGGTTDGAQLQLKDATTSFYASLLASTLTASRTHSLPDESGTLVTHTTKDVITVSTGGNNASLDQTGMLAVDNIGGRAALNTVAGVAQMLLKSASVAFTSKIVANTALTANRTITPMDASGWNATVVARGRSTAQTAAVASVSAFSVAYDASFTINCNVLVTTSSAENFSVKVDYTDDAGTARTQTVSFISLNGSLAPAITSAVGAFPYAGIATTIRAKASTTITVKTIGTFTGCTYNVEATITQISNN